MDAANRKIESTFFIFERDVCLSVSESSMSFNNPQPEEPVPYTTQKLLSAQQVCLINSICPNSSLNLHGIRNIWGYELLYGIETNFSRPGLPVFFFCRKLRLPATGVMRFDELAWCPKELGRGRISQFLLLKELFLSFWSSRANGTSSRKNENANFRPYLERRQ